MLRLSETLLDPFAPHAPAARPPRRPRLAADGGLVGGAGRSARLPGAAA